MPNGRRVTYDAASETYGGDTIDIPLDLTRESNGEKGIYRDGTTVGYRIIYLQRLADPTRPFVPMPNNKSGPITLAMMNAANPYRTIDSMPVDLTTFNGVTGDKDPDMTPAKVKPIHFEARQRGTTNSAPGEFNLWKQESVSRPVASFSNPPPYVSGFFTKGLVTSLGYLNVPYYAPVMPSPLGLGSGYPGYPPAPFPWLSWAYRPFVNEYELLMVPAVSSSKLLARNELYPPAIRKYFGYVDQTMRPGTDSFAPTAPNAPPVAPVMPMNSSYPHLLGMFQSDAIPKNAPPQMPTSQWQMQPQTGQFHRVLAYLGVPTPFAHFAVQANPMYTGIGLPPQNKPGPHWFNQPFNGIPTYREPGRINLNTMSSSDVFMGLLNYHPSLSVYSLGSEYNVTNLNMPDMWIKFFMSRRGEPITKAALNQMATNPAYAMTINAFYPSRFMRPFRGAGGAWLTPPLADGTTPTYPNHEVDVTLMRPDSDPNWSGRPLFQVDDVSMKSLPNSPTGGGPTPDTFPNAAMDYNRSPYFRYQELQKLAGTTTTHSNVFAIWITVGYFEALPAPTQANGQPLLDALQHPIYPDGYQLGQELGADSGDVTRHRAFYIFDRSLPVGFIRGQDVNTKNGFLLQRYIE
jgi:hypothetical protein